MGNDYLVFFIHYTSSMSSFRILFHRGIYPAEDFYMEKRFGLDLLISINPKVEEYIERMLRHARGMLPTL